uniref:GNAT family N-acetyltransferase n=1 Tax=Cephaloticoccus sp. TaxID=1985742 RepID=UPI004049576E
MLRKLTIDDASVFRELRLYGLQESPTAFGASFEQESVQPLEFFAGRIASSADRMVMGAFDGDRLIGMVAFVRDTALKTRHRGAIYSMYVHPDSRGQGAGRELLKALLSEIASLPGLRSVRLSVTVGNDPAQRLYESLGFTVYGEEPEVLLVDGVFHGERHMVRKVLIPADKS